MNLEQQVISLSLAKRLKELGVKQESLYHWNELSPRPDGTPHNILHRVPMSTAHESFAAFTVAELGEMLRTKYFGKWMTEWDETRGLWYGELRVNTTKDGQLVRQQVWGDTEAVTRGQMLVHLIENQLITV